MCDRMKNNHRMFSHKLREVYAGDRPPILIPERLNAPLKRKNPARIGVQFMGDLWHTDVEWNWQYKIFEIMFCNPDHTYIVLTKRPENVKKRLDDIWFHLGRNYGLIKGVTDGYPFPLKNVWIGVSISTQEDANQLIAILLQIPAAIIWVSGEPLLENIILKKEWLKKIGWLVVGCESGPKRRHCKLEYIESLVSQCDYAGIPVFVKQAQIGGKLVSMPKILGQAWDQYPKALEKWPDQH